MQREKMQKRDKNEETTTQNVKFQNGLVGVWLVLFGSFRPRSEGLSPRYVRWYQGWSVRYRSSVSFQFKQLKFFGVILLVILGMRKITVFF